MAWKHTQSRCSHVGTDGDQTGTVTATPTHTQWTSSNVAGRSDATSRCESSIAPSRTGAQDLSWTTHSFSLLLLPSRSNPQTATSGITDSVNAGGRKQLSSRAQAAHFTCVKVAKRRENNQETSICNLLARNTRAADLAQSLSRRCW
jgi:hypothetical protein